MFYFHHPKPFIQKAVAVLIAERRTEPLPDNKTIIVERPALVTSLIVPPKQK